MREEEAASLFQALSNADRLKVIRALVIAGPDGLNAGDIAAKVGASPSRASFHLAALSEARIVQRERRSRSLRYTVDFSRIGELLTFLMDDCCNGSPRLKSCCP
ncbi:helix-turn-helix transcriptional regulator [Pikeienuella piscinae]|uniref:Helix-turn-helix transcriptional regulator n=1 Tax=Pikeienuella piscinae TaxID=2748098 RepID=A0A7L5BX01_9RHOB|nr:metalloregulator ArsR/SmtB family transcription factor [Pikeienuella piscinae]QIE54119.1 helix-turn-helix transcriptional regulator [Pikeienuella piscinae]